MKTIIIVGGGIAGVTAADAARSESPDARIVIIHDEPGMPYMRLNLTRLLAGEVEMDSLGLNKPEWYDENRIVLIHGQAVEIQKLEKKIILNNGEILEYNSLILANGSSSFIPPIPGVKLPGVFALRTLEDARNILAGVKNGTRCLCIGGGLLGIELAVGLHKQGAAVTILEGFGWLLPRQLAPPASAFLKSRIEAMGLNIKCGVMSKEITGTDHVAGLNLENGEFLKADMILLSTGVRSNTELAGKSGLDVGRGVKVDDSMRTNDPVIFAAGDVAEHNGQVYGLWPTAMEQGRVAGANAAGGSEIYKAVAPSAFLKVVGVDMFSAGQFMPDEGTIFEQTTDDSYVRLAICDGKLIGANLLGDVKPAILVRNMINKAEPVLQNSRLLKIYPDLEKFIRKNKD